MTQLCCRRENATSQQSGNGVHSMKPNTHTHTNVHTGIVTLPTQTAEVTDKYLEVTVQDAPKGFLPVFMFKKMYATSFLSK